MGDKDFLIIIGKRIKQIRLAKKIKQVDLAYACNIEKTNLSRIEAGKSNMTLLTIRKICKGLSINLNELFEMMDNL